LVDAIYNTMGKFHGWMNTMGGCHFPFGSIMSSAIGSLWDLDSGASFHMTGVKELFSSLEEKDL